MLYNSLTQSPLFGLSPSSKFKKKHDVSEAGSASVFREEAPNLVDPLYRAVLSHWAIFLFNFGGVHSPQQGYYIKMYFSIFSLFFLNSKRDDRRF